MSDRSKILAQLKGHVEAFKDGKVLRRNKQPLPVIVWAGAEQECGLEPAEEPLDQMVSELREKIIKRRSKTLTEGTPSETVRATLINEMSAIESPVFDNAKLVVAQEIYDRIFMEGLTTYRFGLDMYDFQDILEFRTPFGDPFKVIETYPKLLNRIREISGEFGFIPHFGTHLSGSYIGENGKPRKQHARTHFNLSWNIESGGRSFHIGAFQSEDAFKLHGALSFGALMAVECDGMGLRFHQYANQSHHVYNNLGIRGGRNVPYRIGTKQDEYRCPGFLPDIATDLCLLIGGARYSGDMQRKYSADFEKMQTEEIVQYKSGTLNDVMIIFQLAHVIDGGYFKLPKAARRDYRPMRMAITELTGEFFADRYPAAESAKIYEDFYNLFSKVRINGGRLDASEYAPLVESSHPRLRDNWPQIKQRIQQVEVAGTRTSIVFRDIGRRRLNSVYIDWHGYVARASEEMNLIIGDQKEALMLESREKMKDSLKKDVSDRGVLELKSILYQHLKNNRNLSATEHVDFLTRQMFDLVRMASAVQMSKVFTAFIDNASAPDTPAYKLWGEELAIAIGTKYKSLQKLADHVYQSLPEGKAEDFHAAIKAELSGSEEVVAVKLIREKLVKANKMPVAEALRKMSNKDIIALIKAETKPRSVAIAQKIEPATDIEANTEVG